MDLEDLDLDLDQRLLAVDTVPSYQDPATFGAQIERWGGLVSELTRRSSKDFALVVLAFEYGVMRPLERHLLRWRWDRA